MTTRYGTQTLLSLSLGLAAIAGCDVDPAGADFDLERDLDEQAEDSEGDEASLDQGRPDELAADLDDDATSLGVHWGDFARGGCVGEGERLYSAILWDIPAGVSWEQTCADTSATILGTLLSAPDACVNNGFNMWGEFHVPDLSCAAAPNNLAFEKPATQSSTAFGGDAARAVDGNTDGSYGYGSVSHTGFGPGQWWQVDLESVQRVREVVVHNRTDCCADKLNNFRLSTSVDGTNWKNDIAVRAANPGMAFSIDRQARYVRITNGDEYLHLAEVEVFGIPDSTPVQHWGEFEAGSCTGSDHRRFSAILWDIPGGMSWEDACASTPASIVHDTFVRPTACVNSGLNMWGEFDVRDGSCSAMPGPQVPPVAPEPVVGLSPSTSFSVVLASDPQLYWGMTNNEYPEAPRHEGSRDEVEVTARSHVRAMRLLAGGNQLPAGTTRPEGVIMNGDLTSSARNDEYEAYYRLYDEAELGMPRFDGLGDHDYGDDVVGRCTCAPGQGCAVLPFDYNFCANDSVQKMRTWIGNNAEIVDSDYDSMAYAFVRNNVRFLQLHNYPGYAEPAIGIDSSYAWVTDQMQAAEEAGQFVVLNMHIVDAEVSLSYDAAFADAVDGYEHLLLAIFGGHLHEYQGQTGFVPVNGRSVPVAYGGSQEYNHFTLVQFDLDKVTFRSIDSRDGNVTVVPGSVVEIPYPEQNIGDPRLDIPLTAGSLTDAGSARAVSVSGTSLAADHRGRTDGARQLDGVDDAITINASGWAASNTNTFTLAGWIDWDGVGTSQIGFLFGRDMERMEVHTGGGAGINGLRFIPAGYGPSHVDAPGVLSPGWNHVAFTYTGTTATIYVNGQAVATRVGIGAGGYLPTDLSTESGDLRVGMRANGSFPLGGKVDGIAFYDQALGQADIVKLMLR